MSHDFSTVALIYKVTLRGRVERYVGFHCPHECGAVNHRRLIVVNVRYSCDREYAAAASDGSPKVIITIIEGNRVYPVCCEQTASIGVRPSACNNKRAARNARPCSGARLKVAHQVRL